MNGYNPDGSLTICPEAVVALRQVMLRMGSQIAREQVLHDYLEKFATVLYEKQGIEFEQWT